ncbi:1-aminocyclopropane-1-carboxylate deaminase/D-cysteine desulfhydrase [Mariniflexile gromovii]|uniref:Pyridoxal-phosphate dependent enzyme n=1 Tax=Mariniflexile gromovii TaxID=362523 RepID=A0ABS4BPG3_9FLAO|nr:pyridoxal-phosphate dependent enzyme [Mariniflexile gromovii]MBP0902483.1 pyridoxal-phosphate dependent enzyme [Mariniflexile gromovii]
MLHPITDTFAIYRDDVYPYLGGGNKARKMMALDHFIKSNGYNAIVTTGAIQSNHCRAVAIYCKKNNIACALVLHGGEDNFYSQGGNAKIIRSSDSKLIFSQPIDISKKMDKAMSDYNIKGLKPYYLVGSGHTLEGGKAYIDVVKDIASSDFIPDYIFLASGSGSTQAGILAGLSKYNVQSKVIGISVGRKKSIIENDIKRFYGKLCDEYQIPKTYNEFVVTDDFLCQGYDKYNPEIKTISENSLTKYGVILDTTYTAKAFYGMEQIILKNNLSSKKILFWYTGGIYNYFAK